jgi:hypothetical protein
MKKVAVPTTTARGAAVSRSRITAVQSVYIPEVHEILVIIPAHRLGRDLPPMPLRNRSGRRPWFRLLCFLPLLAFTGPFLICPPGWAGIQFENCVRGPGGSISCDTVPTGNTLMNDIDARYGLLQQASPGWNEFDPYAGYNEDFGGNDT